MGTLVLVRHGQSQWNLANRFTGWWDVDLSDGGEKEARSAGALLAEEGIQADVAHTSVLTRAVRTTTLLLEELGQVWIPVHRHWRLNERHYGELTGLDKRETKARFGEEQFMAWRRSYDTPPPPMPPGHPFDVRGDRRYAAVPKDALPATECLADVVARLVPYWQDAIAPDLQRGATVLVVAHGNSLRALVKHLSGIAPEAITEVEIPTGVPVVYQLDSALEVTDRRELGDPAAIAAAAEAVRRQGDAAPAQPTP